MLNFLNSCISENSVTPNITETVTLTPTLMATITPTAILYQTSTPQPTATLATYTIQSNDTIIGIGKKLDLTPEAIEAVNPGINPSALVVGSSIYLPSNDAGLTTFMITPVPLTISAPICSEQIDQLRCVVNVSNLTEFIAENIGVEMYLIGIDGALIEKRTVPILLNSLHPGETLPAIASFPIVENFNSVQAALSSATYSNSSIFKRQGVPVTTTSTTQWDGRSATVEGTINNIGNKNVWIAALGFDMNGNLCAARRWEWNGEGRLTLDLVSYAEAIDSVQILVESWE